MNPSQTAWESWIHDPSEDDLPPTEITMWVQKLWSGIHTRIAQEAGFQLVRPCNDDFEQRVRDASGQIKEATYLGDGSMLFRDRSGADFLAAIKKDEGKFLISVGRVVITVRRGAIDEPRDVLFATHHTVELEPDFLPIQDVVDGPIEQAFHRLLAMLNELIDPPSDRIDFTTAMRHSSYLDAGTLSYTSGILGAALFMATSIGPGWLGFFATYLPMSILTAVAAAAHERRRSAELAARRVRGSNDGDHLCGPRGELRRGPLSGRTLFPREFLGLVLRGHGHPTRTSLFYLHIGLDV